MSDRRIDSVLHDVTCLVDDTIANALVAGATDIHFDPIDDGLLVRGRVDGCLSEMEVLPRGLAENIISRLKIMSSLLTYRVDIPQEGSLIWKGRSGDGDGTELRVSTFPTIRGERAVVRLFRHGFELHSLETLGFADEQIVQLRMTTAAPAGFIVVSGPAGSGKTTTLYALIREIQRLTPGRSIITLEDPVEQRLDRVAQIQIDPFGERGYERCMRSLLRHDPQVILIGEVRDRQTASIAIEAALTGHLILTTMHSGDAAESIVRFLEMGIPPYQLVSALTLVCNQRLLRLRCNDCRELRVHECRVCLGTGYRGRTAVAQIATFDEDIRTMILSGSSASKLRAVLQEQSADLITRATELAVQGQTDEFEILRVLGSKRVIRSHQSSLPHRSLRNGSF